MKIAIGGDVSITDFSASNFANADEKAAFNNVLDYFRQSDRVIVNLECALTESENRIKKFGPNLKAPKSTADTLLKAGVTDCALSNNHIFDFGIEGLKDTIDELNRVGINWTGIGENYEDSRKNQIIVQDGITIAIVDVCEHEYTYATENRIGARPFDEFETMDDIREAKKSADYVIVIYHGGKEHCRYPSPRLLKACREMAKCGADVVLCQHSHIIGAYEKYENCHILYGQGNFHFVKETHPSSGWDDGLIVMLDITKQKIDIDFVPITKAGNGIDIADEERTKNIMDGFWKRSEMLHTGEWKDGWREFCKSVEKSYRSNFCGFDINDDIEKFQIIAHRIDCEAHCDVLREIFPTWNMTNELDKM